MVHGVADIMDGLVVRSEGNMGIQVGKVVRINGIYVLAIHKAHIACVVAFPFVCIDVFLGDRNISFLVRQVYIHVHFVRIVYKLSLFLTL